MALAYAYRCDPAVWFDADDELIATGLAVIEDASSDDDE